MIQNTSINWLSVAYLFCLSLASVACSDTLYESGALGATGVSWDDAINQVVFATNVNQSVMVGARFELHNQVRAESLGGHFVGPPGEDDMIFAALVSLEAGDDLPDSEDLSAPDVLVTALLEIPEPSQDVSASIDEVLDAGWYAIVFGSGLFGASGEGGAPRNNRVNTTAGNNQLVQFGGRGWGAGPFLGERYFLTGQVIPEPSSSFQFLSLLACVVGRTRTFAGGTGSRPRMTS